MTEQEKIQELLKPRYKVIADYPQHADDDCRKLIIGDVLLYMKVNCGMTYRRIGRCGHMSVGVPVVPNPEKYPRVFKSMDWFEDREDVDMPAYVKHKLREKVIKIEQAAELKLFLPATITEYQQYINSKPQP